MRPAYLCTLLALVVVFVVCVHANGLDCGVHMGSGRVVFDQIDVFPNPVKVHQTLHLRAVVTVPAQMNHSVAQITVGYVGQLFIVHNVDVCKMSSSIRCPIQKGENVFALDWTVPQIPAGEYTLRLMFANGTAGCANITVKIEDPEETDNVFVSKFDAVLEAHAQYEVANVNERQHGHYIQVGPYGYLPAAISYAFPWGRVSKISGTEDIVPPYMDPTGLIWGMYGNMTGWKRDTTNNTVIEHIYAGTFYFGYLGQHGFFNSPQKSFMEGEFTITWSINALTKKPLMVGQLTFDTEVVLPPGWGAPVTIGRLKTLDVTTDEFGLLRVSGSKKYCTTQDQAWCNQLEQGKSQVGTTSDPQWNDRDLGLTIGLILGFAFVIVILIALLVYVKHKREIEQEDGVFSASRKPEYGSALVVDDIIQETKEHGGALLPKLDRTKRLADLDLSEYSSYDETNRTGTETETDRGRSLSPRRGRSGRKKSLSPSASEATLSDGSRSRSVSRSRSISRSSRSRSRSGSRKSRSVSRSVSRSRSPSPSKGSYASDSSRSRSEDEDHSDSDAESDTQSER